MSVGGGSFFFFLSTFSQFGGVRMIRGGGGEYQFFLSGETLAVVERGGKNFFLKPVIPLTHQD